MGGRAGGSAPEGQVRPGVSDSRSIGHPGDQPPPALRGGGIRESQPSQEEGPGPAPPWVNTYLKRLAQSVVTLLIVVTTVFLLMRLLPVEGYLGERYDKLTVEQSEAILQKMGLLDPWYVQIGHFYARLARGDLGVSTIYRKDVPVLEVIAPRVPYSVRFGLTATALSLVGGPGHGRPDGAVQGPILGQDLDTSTSSSSTPCPPPSTFFSFSSTEPVSSRCPCSSTSTASRAGYSQPSPCPWAA